jgi:hypothetical protein
LRSFRRSKAVTSCCRWDWGRFYKSVLSEKFSDIFKFVNFSHKCKQNNYLTIFSEILGFKNKELST